jgi:hypothetical protein
MCFSATKALLSCAKCKLDPIAQHKFSVGDQVNDSYKIPDVLENVVENRDRQLLSLCNLESYFDYPSETTRNRLAHLIGSTDLLRKTTIQLTGMLTKLNIKDVEGAATNIAYMPQCVENALQWLMQNNSLYQTLVCKANVDAIYQEYRDEPIFPQTIVDTGNNINPGILGKKEPACL